MSTGNIPAGNIPADSQVRVQAQQTSVTNQGGGAAVSLGATGRTSPVPNLSGTGEGATASKVAAEKTEGLPTADQDQA